MPILVNQVPYANEHIIAEDIMASKVVTLKQVDKVENILEALKTTHHGFPILNQRGIVTGLIPKNFIIIILRRHSFYQGFKVDKKLSVVHEDVQPRATNNINKSANESYLTSSTISFNKERRDK